MSQNMQNQHSRDAHGRALHRLSNWVSALYAPVQRAAALLSPVFRQGSGRGSALTHGVSLAILAFGITSSYAQAPVITPPSNITVLEDCGRTNVTFTVTDPDT